MIKVLDQSTQYKQVTGVNGTEVPVYYFKIPAGTVKKNDALDLFFHITTFSVGGTVPNFRVKFNDNVFVDFTDLFPNSPKNKRFHLQLNNTNTTRYQIGNCVLSQHDKSLVKDGNLNNLIDFQEEVEVEITIQPYNTNDNHILDFARLIQTREE